MNKKSDASKTMKKKGFSSMKVNIILVNVIAIIATTIFFSIVTIPATSDQIKKLSQENIQNLSNAYGKLMETDLENAEEAGSELTADNYKQILGDVKLEGVSSSYAYLVSSDGTMEYHPTADKIGTPVENEVVKGLVGQLQSGKTPQPGFTEYKFKGAMKYAGYYITETGHHILVVTADESDILKPIKNFILKIVISAVILLVVCFVICMIVGTQMVKPLKILTEIVEKTAAFNFESNPHAHAIMYRNDESGTMGRAIQNMRANLRSMVEEINQTAENISTNAISLKEMSNQVNENSSDNSATSEELAAGMQETSATTENINASIGNVEQNANDINALTVEGESISKEIQDKAENLEKTVVKARKDTEDMYVAVKEKSDKAIEQSKAVNKINDLAKSIMDIASQTSLLALNASIEAARAGESGRGFAVVAEEIGNLANQSAQTVSGITEIVNEVHLAVNNMSECLKTTQDFLENKVEKDYDQFTDVSQQYNNDAHVFQASMQDIHAAIDNLNVTIHDISESISGINNTIGEAAIGVTDIAQKTTDIVSLTSKTYDLVEESIVFADELKQIVSKFKLQ